MVRLQNMENSGDAYYYCTLRNGNLCESGSDETPSGATQVTEGIDAVRICNQPTTTDKSKIVCNAKSLKQMVLKKKVNIIGL